MSQLTNLLNLSPRVQEGLLLGDLHLSERRVRAVAANPQWADPSRADTVGARAEVNFDFFGRRYEARKL